MWEILLIIAIIALLGEKQLAENMLMGVGFAVLLVLVLFVGAVLWFNFPIAFYTLAGVLALSVVAWAGSRAYYRFFSPEAKVKATHDRMRKRYQALSMHIVRIEMGTYERDWAVPAAQPLLARLLKAHEQYKLVPPELNAAGKPMDWEHLVENLQQRLHTLQSKADR
jgi:hypothetical protein